MSSPILLVEDDKDIRFIIRRCLKSITENISEAENGEEALKIIKASQTPYDLIITDLNMPVMNGREFIKQFRTFTENQLIPILVLTSNDDLTIKEDILDIGGDEYITKPFVSREFIAKVKVFLRINQLTKEITNKSLELTKQNESIVSLQNQLLKEERTKVKHQMTVSTLHQVRQPLTNALLLAGVLANNEKLKNNQSRLIESLNEIDSILKNLEKIDTDDSETYNQDIKMYKSPS